MLKFNGRDSLLMIKSCKKCLICVRRADILVVRAQPRTHQRRSCFDPPAAAGTPGINFGEPTSFSSAVFGLTPNGTGAGPMVVSSKPNGALGVSGGTEASNDQQAKLDALKVRSHNVVHAVCPPSASLRRFLRARSAGRQARITGQSRAHATTEAHTLL